MDGRRLGLLSLRVDAAYCLVAGILVAVAAPLLGVPTGWGGALGVGVVAWAALLWWGVSQGVALNRLRAS